MHKHSPGVKPGALALVHKVAQFGDAHLGHGVAGGQQRLLQDLVGAAAAEALQEAALAVGQVEEVLAVGGHQDEAELRGGLQVGDVGVEEAGRVELGQADGRPALALAEGRGRAHQVEEQVQVHVVQHLVLLAHQRHQPAPHQQDGEDQALGLGRLQAGGDGVARGAGQREAGDGAQEQARVSVQQPQQVVRQVLGAGQQPAEVVVLLELEDVVELGEREQADDLVVDVEQLAGQLPLRLTGPRHAHQDQGALA